MDKKFGILTLPFEANYGYILQAFALSKIIEKNNAQPILLNRGWNESNPSLIHRFKRNIYYKYFCKNIISLFKKINQTETIRSSSTLRTVCESLKLNGIIVGSDQVWSVPNTRGAELNYFLDFLDSNSNIKRYSYAASLGKDSLIANAEEKIRIGNLLKKFEVVTVREDSGVDILKHEFDIDSTCVLDPTLLISGAEWDAYVSNYKNNNELVTYILDTNKDKVDSIKQYASTNGLKVYNLYNRRFRPFYSVEHWLTKIRNANFVIVDSFHGMVFAIIFKKQFIAIANNKRGKTRFISLLHKLGLENRLVDNASQINQLTFDEIDYQKVGEALKRERIESLKIINHIINPDN